MDRNDAVALATEKKTKTSRGEPVGKGRGDDMGIEGFRMLGGTLFLARNSYLITII
ncbi:MAG: hypothetical protein ABFD97_03185 [Syntrophobacter sp.]